MTSLVDRVFTIITFSVGIPFGVYLLYVVLKDVLCARKSSEVVRKQTAANGTGDCCFNGVSSEPDVDELTGRLSFEHALQLAESHADEEAVVCCNIAINYGYKYHEVYCLRGACLHSLKRHQEAINDFDKAIDSSCECNTYYMRAMAKAAIEDFVGFEKDMEMAIRIARLDTKMNRQTSYKMDALRQGFSSIEAMYKDTLRMLRPGIDGKMTIIYQCSKLAKGRPFSPEEYDKIKNKVDEDKKRLAIARNWMP